MAGGADLVLRMDSFDSMGAIGPGPDSKLLRVIILPGVLAMSGKLEVESADRGLERRSRSRGSQVSLHILKIEAA